MVSGIIAMHYSYVYDSMSELLTASKTRMDMKKIALLLIAIIASLLLGGYVLNNLNTNKTVEDDAVVSIGSYSRAIDYAPYIIAKKKGFFDKTAENYNFKTNYVEFQTLPSINESIATGNLDIIFEAEPPAIIGKAAGIDLSIVSPGVSLVQEILVPTESNINEVFDLKGKKIAVPSGSSSHYGLNKILTQAGLTSEDVEIIDMNPQDGQTAFVARQIEAWAIWPPFVEQQEYNGTGRVLRGSNVFIQSIVAMRDSFRNENPELARDLILDIQRSQQWIIENPEEAQQIVSEELNIDLAVVVLAWDKHDFNPTIGEKEIQDIQSKADFLYDIGLVKTRVDVKNDLISLY